jgi:hypothetical protein
MRLFEIKTTMGIPETTLFRMRKLLAVFLGAGILSKRLALPITGSLRA